MNAMIGSLCAVAVFLPFRLQAENLNLVTAAGFITAKSTVAGSTTAASTAIAVHDYVWELSKEERTKKSTKKKQTKKEIYG